MTAPAPTRLNQVQQVMWIPLPGPGDFFECQVTGFGFFASGISRSKPRALAFALEALAEKVRSADVPA